MTTATFSPTDTRPALTTRQKVGLVLCLLQSLASLPSFLEAAGPGESGPPLSIMILSSVLGAMGVIATVLAWRGNKVALRVAAGTLIVNAITSLPAFFVAGISTGLRLFVAAGIVLVIVTVVLMFSSARRSAPVSD